MRKLLLTLFFILFAFPVYALELLMAHNPDCHICQNFVEEVAVDYNDSEIAKKLPLIIINVQEQPEWFKEAYRIGKIKPIRGTPTFIVWNGSHEGGHEIARLVGYHDKQRFYSRLKKMLSIED
jgi:thioredoxin-related protein